MTTIGERIRAERERQEISREDLAKAAGISRTTLSDLELGYSKSTTALHKIAARLGVSASWLEQGRGRKEASRSTDSSDWEDVTAYEQSAAMGDGMVATDYAETHKLKFKASSLRRKGLFAKNLAVYYGSGDSMEPRIRDGDAILFDTSDTSPRDDAIFLVSLNGHFMVKRLQKLGKDWFLVSDNREHPKWRKPVPVSFDDGFSIVGRVRWVGSWED